MAEPSGGDTVSLPRPDLGLMVSGGQTGVDRAALDAAISVGLDYGGWCPKGGLAEDLRAPPGLLSVYPQLRETPSADPAQRTEWNVRDSDATVVICRSGGPSSPGTVLTRDLALALGRPLLTLDADSGKAVAEAAGFIGGLSQQARLNFAGPRESQLPGIYAQSRLLIEEILAGVVRSGVTALENNSRSCSHPQ